MTELVGRTERSTVFPPALAPGDTIAVVSPSAGKLGQYASRAARGLDAFRRLGFRTQVMAHARRTGRWTSASVAERLDDLHAAFADPTVQGVITAIGGRGAVQLLPELDLELIAAHPTVFCGYSDATALHCAIGSGTGLVTFYGPSLLMELAEYPEPLPETSAAFLAAVTSAEPIGPVPAFDTIVLEGSDWEQAVGRRREPAPARRTLRDGEASGPLMGGCLPVLCELIGTPWQPDLGGGIVLLETPQAPYSPDQAMSDLIHLVHAGMLDSVAGVAVGWPWSRDQVDDLADVVAANVPGDCPLLFGLPFGHTSPMTTLPLGANAEIVGGQLSVTQPGVVSPEHGVGKPSRTS